MATLRLNAPLDDVEMQMRRALQVGSSGPSSAAREQGQDHRGNRRFAQSGDVPVTRLAARKDNPIASALAGAEEALHGERTLREQAEAALAQANATITALQTKLAHAEMAHAEAMAERANLEAELRNALVPEPDPVTHDTVVIAAADPLPATEEEPVQWWLPGWKGGSRGR